jgi:hypothetical protein
MDGAYLRPSTGSMATNTRICGVIWIIPLLPARRAANSSSPVGSRLVFECASCCHAKTQTQSATLRSSSVAPLAPQRRAGLVFGFASVVGFASQGAASSAPHNPVAAGAPFDKCHTAVPVRPQRSRMTPAIASAVDSNYEIGSAVLEAVQSVPESNFDGEL